MQKALVETTGEFLAVNFEWMPDPDTGKSADGTAQTVKPWRPAVVDLDSNFAQTALKEKRLKLADNGRKLPDDATDDDFKEWWDEAKADQGEKTDEEAREDVIASFSADAEEADPEEIKQKAEDVTANAPPVKADPNSDETPTTGGNTFRS